MRKIDLVSRLHEIEDEYHKGSIALYDYIDLIHSYNKLLLAYSKRVSDSDIRRIEITKDGVFFEFDPLGARFKTDGAARSAPFEILNFGKYEEDDEHIFFTLIRDKKSIFDIGANIGWYSVNVALREPEAIIYSFEPIPITYDFLLTNLKLNKISNVKAFNCGLANINATKELYYFKGGSAIASIKNLLNKRKAKRISCKIETVDRICIQENIPSLDVLKCDIEGSELPALKGAANTLEKFLPIIFIEVFDGWCKKCGYKAQDVFDFLYKYGYKSFRSNDKGLYEVHKPLLEDDGKYNYFFLHPVKHNIEISKLV